MKPEKWSDPDKKLFPHQVGFTGPPMDFDAAPSDFIRICPPSVGLHGRLLHAPGIDAVLVNGMCNFRDAHGLPPRFVSLAADIESEVGTPIVAADLSLYWQIFRTLGVEPVGRHGSLLSSLQTTTPNGIK